MFTELVGDFDNTVAGKKLLLKFHATWCGPCKAIEPTLQKLQEETKVEVLSIDIDLHPEVASKFAIHSVPTTIALDNGTPVDVLVGTASRQAFIELIAKLKLPLVL